jgi:Protein of unknown function, DUF417
VDEADPNPAATGWRLLFLGTLSFLFTTPGVTAAGGFPVKSVLPGQFLLKDPVLLGASVWTVALRCPRPAPCPRAPDPPQNRPRRAPAQPAAAEPGERGCAASWTASCGSGCPCETAVSTCRVASRVGGRAAPEAVFLIAVVLAAAVLTGALVTGCTATAQPGPLPAATAPAGAPASTRAPSHITTREVPQARSDPGAGAGYASLALVGPAGGGNGKLVVFLPGTGDAPSCCQQFLAEVVGLGFPCLSLSGIAP